MATELAHAYIKTNGVTLHVVQAGPEDGPLVLLLHGFPEFWYGWQQHIAALAERGYRVWVPDQRGYNTSDKPKAISAYKTGTLAADVIGLIDAAGRDTASIVAHDWGAAVAWAAALTYPKRIQKLVILNVPHPAVFQKTLATSWAQRRKSWYMFFFQIPWLPETLLRLGNWRGGTTVLVRTSRPNTFSPADLDAYRAAWSQGSAMTAMINWYRALFQTRPRSSGSAPDWHIHVPTLMIWGKKDVALDWHMAQPSIDLCDDGRLVFFDAASHWVQHEEVAGVQALLHDFLPPPTT